MYSWILLLVFFSSAAFAQTLPELYQKALENTSAVRNFALDEKIAKQEKRKVISDVLPTLSANSITVWRDQVANAGAFGEKKQNSTYLNLNQPLFQGGAEYYALGIANRRPKIARLEKHQAEIELYSLVAESFYNLFRIGRELQTLEEQEKTLNARVRTLSKRARIGRNKKTDVLSAQTQLARVRADKAQVESEMLRAEAGLKALTGVNEVIDLKDFEKVEALVVPKLWEENLQETPKLKKMQLQLENAKKEVGISNAGFLPSVGVEGNYYLNRDGNLRDSEWDISLNASWELFSSGGDYSDRKIKKYELEKVELQLTDLKRNLKTDYLAQKSDFIVQQKTVQKLDEAVKLAKQNYNQHVKEANQGLVSQLDVLRALAEYLDVRRAYERQIYNAKIAYVKLRSLAGVRP